MSISQADIENVINLLRNFSVDDLKQEDYDIFQYQGFDPMKVIQAFIKVKNDKNISDDEFISDICKLSAIALIKGSVNSNNIKKMSAEGQKEVKALSSKYGIKMGGGKGQASNVVTFPRIMASFPDLSVRIANKLGGKDFSGGPLLTTRLPQYMKIQVFPGVIPRNLDEEAKKFLLVASLCYSIDQTIQISRMKDPDVKAVASTQNNFVLISHTSPVPVEDARSEVFKSLHIDRDFDDIMKVIKTYTEKIDSDYKPISKSEFQKAVKAIK